MLEVEIVYCSVDKQRVIPLTVTEPCSVERAIKQSTLLQQFPELDISSVQLGLFSQKVSLTTWLKTGDRIEIYRPLKIDPKEARRKRVVTP